MQPAAGSDREGGTEQVGVVLLILPKPDTGPRLIDVSDTFPSSRPFVAEVPLGGGGWPIPWQGQQLDPPYHRSEEAARQVALQASQDVD